jgi:hypothetical protein
MRLKPHTILWGVLAILVASRCAEAASPEIKIAPSGATILRATSPKGKALVTIHTATVEGSCAKSCPTSRVWWDWGVKHVPIVESLDIAINGHKVVAPLSVYSSMFDPASASLRYEKGNFVLRVEGADAGEAYFILVYFNRQGVSELRTFDMEFPEHPTQVTHYYVLTIGK